MPTKQFNVCRKCKRRARLTDLLFETLRDVALGKKLRCPGCGKGSALELSFDFGLSGTQRYKVLDAFLPRHPIHWRHGKSKVEPYTFLIVLELVETGERDVWLPYWHVVTRKRGGAKVKYGQWAPFILDRRFASLMRQARAKGYDI